MPKKCIICEKDAEYKIKDSSEYYCIECAQEHLQALPVLSLIPSTGVPFSVQWFAAGIRLCICCILAVSLRSDLHPAPVGLHFFVSSIFSNWVAVYVWATCGAGSEWVFLLPLF